MLPKFCIPYFIILTVNGKLCCGLRIHKTMTHIISNISDMNRYKNSTT